MTLDECKRVVAKIQLGDNRQVDRLVILEWFDTIGDLDFTDAIGAVKLHRQENPAYLMGAHVIANAGRVRLQRERTDRINAPRAIEGNHITLDRDEFELLTLAAIEAHRAGKVLPDESN